MPRDDLLQGPVLKNQALIDVEYVLRAVAGLETGMPKNPVFSLNLLDQVQVLCPNGKTYNLSLALRYANLEYFSLTEKDAALLNALKEKDFIVTTETTNALSEETPKLMGEIHPIFQAEQVAIREWTSGVFQKWNALLRGDPVRRHYPDLKIEKDFVSILLAVSGVNKNIDTRILEFKHTETTEVVEGEIKAKKGTLEKPYDGQLIPDKDSDVFLSTQFHRVDKPGGIPSGLFSKMRRSGEQHFFSGLRSFSAPEGSFNGDDKNFIRIKSIIAGSRQKSIANVSRSETEKEILYSPMTFYNERAIESAYGKIDLFGRQVRGVATEQFDQYLVELALTKAYESHLSKPYSNGSDRSNHGLAHHVRVVSYADVVRDYLEKFSEDAAAREFYKNLTHEAMTLIKVMLAYSKVGRDSEVAPLENLKLYQEYQVASGNLFADFARRHTQLTDDEIAYYHNILSFMGNPKFFEEKSTGTEDQKRIKGYINHILALAHKLDLQRCYTKKEFDDAVAIYATGSVVISSAEQGAAFDKLKKLSKRTIDLTENDNRSPRYCMDLCIIAQDPDYESRIEFARKFDSILSKCITDEIKLKKIKEIVTVDQIENVIHFFELNSDIQPLLLNFIIISGNAAEIISWDADQIAQLKSINKNLSLEIAYQFMKDKSNYAENIEKFKELEKIYGNEYKDIFLNVLNKKSDYSIESRFNLLKKLHPIYASSFSALLTSEDIQLIFENSTSNFQEKISRLIENISSENFKIISEKAPLYFLLFLEKNAQYKNFDEIIVKRLLDDGLLNYRVGEIVKDTRSIDLVSFVLQNIFLTTYDRNSFLKTILKNPILTVELLSKIIELSNENVEILKDAAEHQNCPDSLKMKMISIMSKENYAPGSLSSIENKNFLESMAKSTKNFEMLRSLVELCKSRPESFYFLKKAILDNPALSYKENAYMFFSTKRVTLSVLSDVHKIRASLDSVSDPKSKMS